MSVNDKKIVIKSFTDAALSVIGNHKSLNEDAFKASADNGLWVVADGMGGYAGGEIASELAVTHITHAVNSGLSLVDAIKQAHEKIFRLASSLAGKKGMATTVVAVKIVDSTFEIAWVGDSRAYLFEEGQLTQLTHDHSLIQELIDKGNINEQQAKIHPQRHLLSQALGSKTPPKIDCVHGQIEKGILLLCTDGLSSQLSLTRIVTILKKSKPLSWKANKLIKSVLKTNGNDNITALLIQNTAT